MKREVISEAMNNISEQYRLEALELHNKEVVSDVTNMSTVNSRRKFITVGIAAAVTFALGVTAFAAAKGMNKRDAEANETVTIDYPAEAEFDMEEQVIVYEDLSKIFTFDGPETCNEIQFKPTYLPEGYDIAWGELNGWNDSVQCVRNNGEAVLNINVYYSAEFGPDGKMFFQDNITEESEEQDGEFIIYKLAGTDMYDSSDKSIYYMKYNTVEGYVIVVDGSESMDICEQVAKNIEVQQTGSTVTYTDYDTHDVYMGSSVG